MSTDLVVVNASVGSLNPRLCLQTFLHGRCARTVEQYRCNVETFLEWCEASKTPLEAITLPMLQQYMDSLPDNLKNVRITVLKAFFSSLKKMGVLHVDVACMLRCPKQKETLHERILTEDEVQRLISTQFKTDQKRNELILKLLYATGMRVSELCNLEWSKVVDRDNGCCQLSIIGKGGRVRSLFLTATVTALLKDYKSKRVADRKYVFTRPFDQSLPITSQLVWSIVKEACRISGINPNASPHWLRHCMASHALDNKAPIQLVQQTLGHSSLSVTGLYCHARINEGTSQFLNI